MHTTQCAHALSAWNTWMTNYVYQKPQTLVLFMCANYFSFISSFQCAVCSALVSHLELHFPSGLSLQWSGVAAGVLSASLPVLTGVWSVLRHRDSRGRRAHTGAPSHTCSVKAVVLILALELAHGILYPTMQCVLGCCKDLIFHFQCSKEAEVTSLMRVKAFKQHFYTFSCLTGWCCAA